MFDEKIKVHFTKLKLLFISLFWGTLPLICNASSSDSNYILHYQHATSPPPIDQLRFKLYYHSPRFKQIVVQATYQGSSCSQILKDLKGFSHCYTVNKSYQDIEAQTHCLSNSTEKVIDTPFADDKAILAIDQVRCNPMPATEATDHPFIDGRDKFNNIERGKLTPFWAQEAVGSFEARTLLHNYENKLNQEGKDSLSSTNIGIIDGEFNVAAMAKTKLSPALRDCLKTHKNPKECGLITNYTPDENGKPKEADGHGSAVTHLIINTGTPIGVSSKGQVSIISSAPTGIDYLKAFDYYFKTNLGEGRPQVVNMSMGLPNFLDSQIHELLQESTLVASSGNSYPAEIDTIKQENPQIIVVGSVVSNGTSSMFSQEGKSVDIVAPSDTHIQSVGADGETLRNFGGTSGATPLVTGVVADLQSLLPGATPEELTIILKRSSIPVIATMTKGNNGAGSLNAYGAFSAAIHLRESGWPKNRNKVNSSSTYDFSKKASNQQAQAVKLLQEMDCQKRRMGFHLLRQAFFMDPRNEETRRQLAEIYRSYGYESQANYYEPPQDALKSTQIKNYAQGKKIFSSIKNKNIKRLRKLLNQGASAAMTAGSTGERGSGTTIANVSRLIDDPQLACQMIDLLVEHGASANPSDKGYLLHHNEHTESLSALTWASAIGSPQLVQKLLSTEKFDINYTPDVTGRTATYLAAEAGNSEILKMLIAHGANVNASDIFSQTTPLTQAVENGHVEAVKLLLEAGANKDVKVFNQYSLEVYCQTDCPPESKEEILKLLRTEKKSF